LTLGFIDNVLLGPVRVITQSVEYWVLSKKRMFWKFKNIFKESTFKNILMNFICYR